MTDKTRELVIPPHSYLYMQDQTKGTIRVVCGPSTINQSQQEAPIVYAHKQNFRVVNSLAEAVRVNALAVEGCYLEVLNPASNRKSPEPGTAQLSVDLDVGCRINIHGPVNRALWPGESAKAIRGHHLRPNQYLLGRIYNADQAKRHWNAAVINTIEGEAAEKTPTKRNAVPIPDDLFMGKTFIIKGTDVSFYMPPTGVVVESEEDANGGCVYVREALTLEQLEYCWLVSDRGVKRREKGPQVVFPNPDEKFITVDGKRKFHAIELNEIQGIHVKVTAAYKDAKGVERRPGEEIFITGKDQPIYFPHENESIVRYDGKDQHFATAVPAGDGRYVMGRKTGVIKLVEGPIMLLPDPVEEVIVRRVLSPKECDLLYPGNVAVKDYNDRLREVEKRSPTTRSGVVSEGDASRNRDSLEAALSSNRGGQQATNKGRSRGEEVMTLSTSVQYESAGPAYMEPSRVGTRQRIAGADEMTRSATYTEPRTITLSQFHGAPKIKVYSGFAVMVTDATGGRRVVEGPQAFLLQHHETLEHLTLSTGKPKTTDKLLETAYLQVHNRITDLIDVVTRDNVKIQLKLEYNCRFEGDDKTKWFRETNYVKMVCDHVRSLLRGATKAWQLVEFYDYATDYIRDTILGKKPVTTDGQPKQARPGLVFDFNALRVFDVNVLNVTIDDGHVRTMIESAQRATVESVLKIARQQTMLSETERTSAIDLQLSQITANLHRATQELQIQQHHTDLRRLESELAVNMATIANKQKELLEQQRVEAEAQKLNDLSHHAEAARAQLDADNDFANRKREVDLQIEEIRADAAALVEKMTTIKGPLAEAMVVMSNNDVAEKIAEALSVHQMVGGKSFVDMVTKIFDNTPIGPYIKQRFAGVNGGGGHIEVVQPRL